MNFVIVGIAGYVAPKHIRAIQEVGGNLIAALDPHSSVGILDSYFPDCQYFYEFERFDRFCSENKVDYVVICSPNYLHDSHVRFSLRLGANIICEKPLVLNPWNLQRLKEIESESAGKVNCILQLRLTSTAKKLKQEIDSDLPGYGSLKYYTPRGDWYDYTWKQDVEKSGGLATNIGIHLFDLLLWLFGEKYEIIAWQNNKRNCFGRIKFGNMNIDIDLSIDKNKNPTRILKLDSEEFDFSKDFGDLHTESYRQILAENGFGLDDAFPSISLCSKLRRY